MFEPENPPPASGRDRLLVVGLSIALAAAFAADLLTAYEPAKLSIPFMLLAWAPLLVLHESAHAVAARAVGWHIDHVVIGFGGTLAHTRVAGIPVEVRVLPVEGFVLCRPTEIVGVRWKSVLIYLAGPGSQIVLALAILAFAGPDVLLARSQAAPVIALQSVALASAVQGVINLMPHSTLSGSPGAGSGEMPSDGLGILQSLTRPLADWETELRRRRWLDRD